MKKDVTLLINSCDAYKDILDPFFELLHRYWKDLPFDIVLTTESLNYKNKYFKIKNVHPKNTKCSWTRRIYEALKEVDTDYVLFMLDDLFIFDTVNTEEILNGVKELKKNKHIVNFTYWPITEGSISSNIDGYRIRKLGVKYKIAAIAALWNKKQFIKYVKDIDEDIWEFEVNGTIRSNTIYKDDIFYTTEQDNVPIPYDFTKLGLISGKWFKNNIPLFKKEKIKMDFTKRGIFDETLFGRNRSFISSFKVESYAIPNISTENYNPVIVHKKSFPKGKFKLQFNVKDAKEMIRITLSEQSGFGVKDSKIEVTYQDNTKELININKVFGSFIKQDDMLVFYNGPANLYIPIKKKKAKTITYSGESICPLEEEVLKSSYQKSTESKKLREKELAYLLDLDRIIQHLGIQDSLVIKPKLNNKIYSKQTINNNNYHYEFKIDNKRKHDEILVLSNDVYFSIRDLKIRSDNKDIIIKEGLPIMIEGYYLYLEKYKIKLEIPKNTDTISIDFKLVNPAKKDIFSKMFISGHTNKIDRIRRRIIWKLKKIIAKLNGKKTEN